jgi:hypothetical protein
MSKVGAIIADAFDILANFKGSQQDRAVGVRFVQGASGVKDDIHATPGSST